MTYWRDAGSRHSGHFFLHFRIAASAHDCGTYTYTRTMVPSEVRDAVRDVVSRVVDASTADYPGVQMRRRLGIDGQVVTESRVVELLNQEYEEEHRRRTALEARVAALEIQVADTVRLRAVACAMYDTVLWRATPVCATVAARYGRVTSKWAVITAARAWPTFVRPARPRISRGSRREVYGIRYALRATTITRRRG